MAWVLQHAAELANRCERRLKASVVVAADYLGATLAHDRPRLAGWMRDDAIRAVIQTGVTLLVPRINAL
jgi:hypothetical protein